MHALFVTMDGGGNLPPALLLAREVTRRGGTARFLGHATQRAAIERAGFAFLPYTAGREYDSAAPRSTASGLWQMTGVFADRGIGRDAIAEARREPTEVVVADCLLWGALEETVAAGLPVASLVHTLWDYFRRNAAGPVGWVGRLHGAHPTAAFAAPSLSLVTARRDFELEPDAARPAGVHHVGVLWQDPPVQAHLDRGRPRVLLSLSTSSFPGQQRALQHCLDALADLPVDVVATTGPSIDPADLRAPDNAKVYRRLDHGEVLPTTSLVIGHGGHGTTVRALAHGIPVLVLPMHPLMDQPAIGRAVVRHGAGRVLSKRARPAEIRAVVEALLADGPERAGAARLGESIREQDGAVVAVDLLLSQLVHARRRRTRAGGP